MSTLRQSNQEISLFHHIITTTTTTFIIIIVIINRTSISSLLHRRLNCEHDVQTTASIVLHHSLFTLRSTTTAPTGSR